MGTGPHLCFLHGFCENQSIWESQIEILKKTHTCWLFDLPGFGQSSLKGLASIAKQADVLNLLLDHLAIEDICVFGHSMGGYIAVEMVSQRPDKYNGIAMIHSTALEDKKTKKANRQKVLEFVNSNGAEAFLKQFFLQLVAPSNQERLSVVLWAQVKDTSKEAILNATSAMMNRRDHLETIQQLKIPVLFLCGSEDQHFPISDVYLQISKSDLGQIEIIDNTGHLSMLESPDECSAVILDFLRFKTLSAIS
ncbi:MAG: alpha/beta hydrolase [Bacteroidia bacterium]